MAYRPLPQSLDAYLAELDREYDQKRDSRAFRAGHGPGYQGPLPPEPVANPGPAVRRPVFAGGSESQSPLTVYVAETENPNPVGEVPKRRVESSTSDVLVFSGPNRNVDSSGNPIKRDPQKPYSRYGRYEGMQMDPEAEGAKEGGLLQKLTGWGGLNFIGEGIDPNRRAARQRAEQGARAYNSQLEAWARDDLANDSTTETQAQREARRQYEWEVGTGQRSDQLERQLAREGRLQELREKREQEAHALKMAKDKRRGMGQGGSPRAAGGVYYDKALEAMERGDLAGMRTAAQEADAAGDYKTADKIRADIAAKIKIGDTTARTERAAEERHDRADAKERRDSKKYFVEKTAPFRDLSAAIAELEPFLEMENIPGVGATGWAPRVSLSADGKRVRNAQELLKETYGRAQSGAAIGVKEDGTFGALTGIDWASNMTDQELRDRVRLLKRWNEANINHFRAYDPEAAAEAEADFGGSAPNTYRVTAPDGAAREMQLTPQQAKQWASKGGKVERVQ